MNDLNTDKPSNDSIRSVPPLEPLGEQASDLTRRSDASFLQSASLASTAAGPMEARSTPKEAALAAFHQGCQRNLNDALKKFVGLKIAELSWKRARESETSSVQIFLADIEPKNKYGTVQVSIRRASEAPVDVPLVWGMLNLSGSILAKFRFNKRSKKPSDVTWQLLSPESFSVDAGEACLELVNETAPLTRRRDNRLDHFGAVWFRPRGADGKLQAVRPGVMRTADPWTDTTDQFWPTFAENAEDGAWTIPLPDVLINDEQSGQATVQTDWDDWARCFLSAMVWALVSRLYATEPGSDDDIDGTERLRDWLPTLADYVPQRPVDLVPDDVTTRLKNGKHKLEIPWHVVEAACAALNSGKHVIFTGPPGCGKSKLAEELARIATGVDPLLATASPAWSAGDLIGRYMPRIDGKGLVFKPGFFLRAVTRGSQWLLIDEFNRADIDACFGELFSVLAGDPAELPFEEEIPASDGLDAGHYQIRIVPYNSSGEAQLRSERFRDYSVGERFRILGTMNDSDRSQLHQLSFALQRRMAIIRVDAPEPSLIAKLIGDRINEAHRNLGLEENTWNVGVRRKVKKSHAKTALTLAQGELDRLFASPNSLVKQRIVGMATVMDVIQFVAEGIRTRSQTPVDVEPPTGTSSEELQPGLVAEELVLSYLALALSILVFPQFEALSYDDEKFEKAIGLVLEAFEVDREKKPDPPRFWQVEASSDDPAVPFVMSSERTTKDFLLDDLRLRFPSRSDVLKTFEAKPE